jgi:hypothetical protein
MTKNQFKVPESKLTPTEMFIGAFSFTVGGVGIIYVGFTIWDFIVTVFG